MSDVVLYEVADRVATITLNRPEARNALSRAVIALLPELVLRADADPDVDAHRHVDEHADPERHASADQHADPKRYPGADQHAHAREPADGDAYQRARAAAVTA